MILYGDFETSTELVNGKVNCYLWGLVSNDNVIREYGINLDSFFNYIFTLPEAPVIYFHNISWDGTFIVHHLLDKGFVFVENLTHKSKNNSFTWIADYNTNIYSIKIKTRYGIITFLDSLKLLVSSVDNLGKALNLPKLEIDYDKYTSFDNKADVPQELIDYLFRDIDIVKEFMKNFSTKVKEVKTTLASTMYNEFQSFYGRTNFINDFGNPNGSYSPLTLDQWKHIKKSYNGGFTAIAPRFVEQDLKGINGYSYDWNSMYPSVMLNYRIPYGKPTNFKVEDTDLELLEIRIFSAVKTDEYLPNTLPNEAQALFIGKYVERLTDTTIVMWKDEFNEILKMYDIRYYVISTMYFRSKYVFKEFIEQIKSEKINAKDAVDRFIAKIKQNSLYGKFGQSIERVSKILTLDKEHLLSGKRYGSKQEWVETKKTTITKSISYIAIASYITSVSRTLLFRAMIANRENFIYCDTDSLYLLNEIKGVKIDDKEYGALKLEHKFDRFKALKLKCYMLNDIESGLMVKVAGLPQEAQKQLNFDNFYRGYKLENSKLQKKHNIGGLILENIDYTL